MGWKCTKCPSSNDDDTKFVCPACGYLDKARKEELASATLDLPLPPGPWTCGACTMENPETAHTCFVCGTADEGRKKRLGGRDGGNLKSLTPETLARAATDDQFSLHDLLTDLCQTLAITTGAILEAGIDRPHLDAAYVPILLDVMRRVQKPEGTHVQGWSRVTNLDVALLACRALNYFMMDPRMQVSQVIRLCGVNVLLECVACFSGRRSQSSAMDLSEEAMNGLELLYTRIYMQLNSSLRDSQTDLKCIRLLANYVQVCLSFSTGSASQAKGQVPSGRMKGISRALKLLRLLVDSNWKVHPISNSSQTPSTFPEKDAVLSALYMVIRHCGTQPEAQTVAALSLLVSVVTPCLLLHTGTLSDLEPLVAEYDLLAKCMSESTSMPGVQGAAVELAYQLLTCSELCEAALRPPAPICVSLCQLLQRVGEGISSGGNRQNWLTVTPSITSCNQLSLEKLGIGGGNFIDSMTTLSRLNQHQCMGLGLVRLAGLIGFVLSYGFLPPFLKLSDCGGSNRSDRNKIWNAPGEEVEVTLISHKRKTTTRVGEKLSPKLMEIGKSTTGQLLAELGDGTCLVCWGDGHESVIPCNRVAPRLSFAAKAQQTLTRALLSFTRENTGHDMNVEFSSGISTAEELTAAMMMRGLLRFGGRGKREPGGSGLNNNNARSGQSLLHHFLKQCITSGNPSMARKIIAEGADVNVPLQSGMLPLMMTILHHKQTDVLIELVQVLLDGGADPNVAGEHGTTALHCAARLGYSKVVHALLNAGADVNARDDEDLSPLDVCPEEETLLVLSNHIYSTESKNNVEDAEIVHLGESHEEVVEVEEKEGKYIKQSVFDNVASTSDRDQVNKQESSRLVYTHPDFYPLEQVVTKEPAAPPLLISSSKVELGRALLRSLIIGCESKVLDVSLAPLGRAWLTVTLGILQSPLEGNVYETLLEPETQSAVLSIVGTLLDNSGFSSKSSSTTQCTTRRAGLQSQALAFLLFTLRRWPESNFKLLDRLGVTQKVSSLCKGGEEDTTDPVTVAAGAVLQLYNQVHVLSYKPEGPSLQEVCSSLMMELTTMNREEVVNLRLVELQKIVSGVDGVTTFEALESKLVDILLGLSDSALIQAATPSLVDLCREILGTVASSCRSQGKTKFSLPFLLINRGPPRNALLSSGLLASIGSGIAGPISLQLRAQSHIKDMPGASFRSMETAYNGMRVSITPDTSTYELRRLLITNVILQHPNYVAYCRRVVGKMVRIWNGPLVSGRVQLQWKQQGHNSNQQQTRRHSGNEIQLCQETPSGCTMYRVLGFDHSTGTHLLKYIPVPMEDKQLGIPEIPPEEYTQMVLAEYFYQVLISDTEREDSVSGSSRFAVDPSMTSPLTDGNDPSSVLSNRKIQPQVTTNSTVSGECRTEAGINDSIPTTHGSCVNPDIHEIGIDVEAKVLPQDGKDVVNDDSSSNKCTAGSSSCSSQLEEDSAGVVGCSSSSSSVTSSKHLLYQQRQHCRIWLQQSSNPFLWVTGSVVNDQQFRLDDAPPSAPLVSQREIQNVMEFPSAKIWGGKRKNQKQLSKFAFLGGSMSQKKQQKDYVGTDKQETDNLRLRVQHACGGGDGDGNEHMDFRCPTSPHVVTPHSWLSSTPELSSSSSRRRWGLGRLIQPDQGEKMARQQVTEYSTRYNLNRQDGGGTCEKVNAGENEYELARQGWMQPPILKLCVKIDTGVHELTSPTPWLELEDSWTICKSLGDLWHISPVTKSNNHVLSPIEQVQTVTRGSGGGGGGGTLGSRVVGKEDTGHVAIRLLFDIVVADNSKSVSDIASLPAAPALTNTMFIQRGVGREMNPFSKAILLLRRLRDLIPPQSSPPQTLEGGVVLRPNFVENNVGQEEITEWTNPKLVDTLSEILEDPVFIGFGAVPCWVDAIFCGGGAFLIPWSMRLEYFRRTAFGPVRGLEWLLSAKDTTTSAERNLPSSGPPRQESNTNRVKDTVVVHRETLLADAEAIMRVYGSRISSGLAFPAFGLSTVLEYRFSGEKGLGSGVTASFYTSIASRLYERGSCQGLGLWVDPERQGSQGEHIFHPNGLFPAPLPSDPDDTLRTLSYFRLIGRLAARCLLDNRIFPLPLSFEFLELVLCQAREGTRGPRSLSPMEMKRIYLEPAVVVERLGQAVRKHQQLEGHDHGGGLIDGLSLKDFLHAACLSMVDPIDGSPLEQKQHQHAVKKKKSTPQPADVNLTNAEEYVALLHKRWSRCGWAKQVYTFVEGIRDLFEPSKLLALGTRGLRRKLCGEMDFDWDTVDLVKAIVPGAGYTEDSPPYRAFLALLAAMPLSDKQRFLLFVTGCPVLPFGGLCSLSPPLTIVRKRGKGGLGGMFNDLTDSDLPFVRTCTHTLHLPPFSNEGTMRERLFYAMDCSADIIDRD